jgi:hypothetical protein
MEDSYAFCWKCGAKRPGDTLPIHASSTSRQMGIEEQREKWEYHTLMLNVHGFFGPSVDYERFSSELNILGESGWELVSVFDVNIGEGVTASIVAIFKRPA